MEKWKDNHCRICLKIKQDIFSIYSYEESEYLPTVIYQISGVKISPNLEPNAQICTLCAAALVAAQTIILSCQEADEYKTRNRWRRKSSSAEEEEEHEAEALELDEHLAVAEEVKEAHLLDQQAADTAAQLKFDYEDVEAMDEHYAKIDSDEGEDEDECASEAIVSEAVQSPAAAADAVTNKSAATHCKRTRDPIKTPRFDCDRCAFQSKTGKTLIEHRRHVHKIDDPLIYACTLCTERFAWKPTLYRHIQRDHQQRPAEKRFACELCTKAYTRQVHLTEHMRQTHEPRRYKCSDPQCEQTFTRAFTLQRHFQAAHDTVQRYHCADCDKYFKIYDLWKYHNKVVHQNQTVYCPRCGYPFRYKGKLEEHLQREACKRSVIPCPYCQRRFTAKNGLREHLKHIHRMA